MIKENLEKEVLVSGTGKKYHFTKEKYFEAVKFISNKFNRTYNQAKSQLNYFLVTAITRKNGKIVDIYDGKKSTTNARLNNIVNLDYEWIELFND